MNGEDQDTDADEHDQRGEDDRLTELRQDRLTCPAFVEQTFHHEDSVVVTLTEDEGRQDDIDDIELQSEEAHDRNDPDPTEYHRHKSDEGYRQAAETEPQEQKDDERTGDTYIIEVIAKPLCQAAEIKTLSGFPIPYEFIERRKDAASESHLCGFVLDGRNDRFGVVGAPIRSPLFSSFGMLGHLPHRVRYRIEERYVRTLLRRHVIDARGVGIKEGDTPRRTQDPLSPPKGG